MATSTAGAPRRSASRIPVSCVIAGPSGPRGRTNVSNVPAVSSPRTRTAPISQISEVRAESPVVSRSTTTKVAASSGRSSASAPASATCAPVQTSRASDSTTSPSSERASPAGALASAKSERAASAAGHGPAPFLDELDEPIRGIQTELHPVSMTERMFV